MLTKNSRDSSHKYRVQVAHSIPFYFVRSILVQQSLFSICIDEVSVVEYTITQQTLVVQIQWTTYVKRHQDEWPADVSWRNSSLYIPTMWPIHLKNTCDRWIHVRWCLSFYFLWNTKLVCTHMIGLFVSAGITFLWNRKVNERPADTNTQIVCVYTYYGHILYMYTYILYIYMCIYIFHPKTCNSGRLHNYYYPVPIIVLLLTRSAYHAGIYILWDTQMWKRDQNTRPLLHAVAHCTAMHCSTQHNLATHETIQPL